jgi:hypothetical protein
VKFRGFRQTGSSQNSGSPTIWHDVVDFFRQRPDLVSLLIFWQHTREGLLIHEYHVSARNPPQSFKVSWLKDSKSLAACVCFSKQSIMRKWLLKCSDHAFTRTREDDSNSFFQPGALDCLHVNDDRNSNPYQRSRG